MLVAQTYVDFFQKFDNNTPIEAYKHFFDENSYFEDPFQKVKGVEKIYHIFQDMYAKLYKPKFEIKECISQHDVTYIQWIFSYQMDSKAEVQSFIGISRVVFSKSMRVKSHIDYTHLKSNYNRA